MKGIKQFVGKLIFLIGFAILLTFIFIPNISARDSLSTRKGTTLYPLYWSAYEPCYTADAPLDETRWKNNIDWVSDNLLPYGYNMVTTDGWLGGSTQTTQNGYLLKYNDNWTHDWAYWANYCTSKGLAMGVYYNPLWIIDSVRDDPTKTVIGTNIPVRDIYTAGFADVTKEGSKQYIQGYVKYFKDMGVRFLRIDFLCWYETGAGSGGAPPGVPAWGSENYAKALEWIEEAAGDDMEISLVMPNSLNHAANEVKYGDLMRVATDSTNSDWTWLNKGSFGDERQTWNSVFCQWANPFQGLTGFSDVAGRGNLTLDGDFLRIHGFNGTYADNEKRSAVSLFTMAGAPLAVADQFDTIGSNLRYFTNPEILALKQDGFVGKPIYYNGNPFEPSSSGQPDTGSRDSERWIGQTSRGDWVVALFNRSDQTVTKSIDFASILGLQRGGFVHDIWKNVNIGFMSSYSASLAPHDVSMIVISPNNSNHTGIRYEAETASFRNGAHFNNDHTGQSGNGFVDQLSGDHPGANVMFGVNAAVEGNYQITLRYANASGLTSGGLVKAEDLNGTEISTSDIEMPSLGSWDNWGNVTVNMNLNQGINLISVIRPESAVGAFNLDCLDVSSSQIINSGFENGNLNGWISTGSASGVDNSDAYGGEYKAYFWSTDPFTQKLNQTFAIANGVYYVTAKVKQNTGVPDICQMEISAMGGETKVIHIPHNEDYMDVGSLINVTTGKMDIAFYESSSGNTNLQMDDITILPCENVENFGFETGDLSGWTSIGNSAGVDNSDVYRGNFKAFFWNSGAYQQKLEQTISGLSDGLHMVTAWVKQDSGNPSSCKLVLSDSQNVIDAIDIPHSTEYVQLIRLVDVKGGQLKLSFQLDGSGCNLQMDNVIVY